MQDQNTMTAQSATELALIYAYPLLAYQKAFSSLSPLIGVNHFGHSRQLATSTNRYVVKPNVDTLYSTSIFDVSNQDVIVKLPAIPEDQYALLSFHSLYGDNFAIVDRQHLDHTKAFRLSNQQDDSTRAAAYHNQAHDAFGEGLISSPTTFGFVMVRWLVKRDNLSVVHSLQNSTTIEVLSGTNDGKLLGSPTIDKVEWSNSNVSPAEDALRLLCQVGAGNRPKPVKENLTIEEVMEKTGLFGGIKTTSIDLDVANSNALAYAKTAGQEATRHLNNGWSAVKANLTGVFGPDHGLRMEIASTGYLMLRAPYALYPSWTNGTAARPMEGLRLELGPNECYIYTFSGKPKLHGLGFWSLTAYDADGYLVDNSRNVYSLGDRSDIRYSSGEPVYGSESNAEQDAPFQLLIQPADVTPPSNWTDNWLPGPKGGGKITALLRWYNADESLMDGSYQYPVVTKQGAYKSMA